jgi:flagellin
MALFINTNVSSLRSQRSLQNLSKNIDSNYAKISSGSRITSAKDDAAGLAITSKMTAREKGIKNAIKNANDYLSLYQTAEGALSEINGMLQRVRELAVQSANVTNNASDRAGLQAEVDQLKDEMQNIAENTNFNGIKILDGTFLNKLVQNTAGSEVKELTSVKSAKINNLGKNVQVTSKTGVLIDNAGGDSSFISVPLTFVVDNGDGTTKDVSIRETTISDDTISPEVLEINSFAIDPTATPATRMSSAIAKAKAINAASEFTGIRAVVGETRTDDNFALLAATLGANPLVHPTVGEGLFLGSSGAISAITLGGDNVMIVNGAVLGNVRVENYDATGSLRDEINRHYESTGVEAQVNAKGELVLVAKDGRNIMINYKNSAGDFNSNLSSKIGLKSAELGGIENWYVYGGKLTLISDKNIEIKGSNNAGLYDISEILGGISSQYDPATGNNVMDDTSKTFIFGLSGGKSIKDVDITTADSASKSLILVDYAIDDVSSIRAGLGAKMNRLESTVQALSVESQSMSATISRIKDTDIATEVTNLTQNQIVQQAAVNVLAQTNQNGAQVLSLLGNGGRR